MCSNNLPSRALAVQEALSQVQLLSVPSQQPNRGPFPAFLVFRFFDLICSRRVSSDFGIGLHWCLEGLLTSSESDEGSSPRLMAPLVLPCLFPTECKKGVTLQDSSWEDPSATWPNLVIISYFPARMGFFQCGGQVALLSHRH